MKRYTIRAYDKNHNELWITIGTSHVGAQACRHTDQISNVLNTYYTKTGKIIDPETGLPVIRKLDPSTGKRSQGSRRIAYFRVYDNNEIFEINITRYGREVGIRNYEARRPADRRSAGIVGHAPIHTGPRIVKTDGTYSLELGEGDPDSCKLSPGRNADRWGDPALRAASCRRITNLEAGWWGYAFENHVTWDHYPMERATGECVKEHLLEVADELAQKFGVDFTQW